jgi:hypothetical protein
LQGNTKNYTKGLVMPVCSPPRFTLTILLDDLIFNSRYHVLIGQSITFSQAIFGPKTGAVKMPTDNFPEGESG